MVCQVSEFSLWLQIPTLKESAPGKLCQTCHILLGESLHGVKLNPTLIKIMLLIISKILTLPSSPAASTARKQVPGHGVCLSQWLSPRAQLWVLMRVAKVGKVD